MCVVDLLKWRAIVVDSLLLMPLIWFRHNETELGRWRSGWVGDLYTDRKTLREQRREKGTMHSFSLRFRRVSACVPCPFSWFSLERRAFSVFASASAASVSQAYVFIFTI